ncbi:MAG TPA: sulfatase [Longimicrobiaceae bacterium]
MNARRALFSFLTAGMLGGFAAPAAAQDPRPNIIVIFADDLGYGDLGLYGHPTIRTPNLDRMAAEGIKLTQFYTAASVCTPSRAGLLTGRLPVRSGMAGDRSRVLFPNSTGGLPQSEITIAEALKERGYATAAIGKWHLGHLPEFLPRRHGFDLYYGIPYSNDMESAQRGDPPLPLMRNEEIIEQPADQTTLTRRYTEVAIDFMRANRDRPFFIYLPHTFPHVPLYASDAFRGRSPRGIYGDVVEEMDWSVGRILEALREMGIAERTLVVFTSDNGPWLTQGLEGGTAGLLREGKGSTWEGGMRVPAIAWWPGTIAPARVSQALATTMDLFPTAVAMAGATPPADREMDGVSLLPLLRGEREEVRETVFFYRGTRLFAVRKGAWKGHFVTQSGYGGGPAQTHEPLALYRLDQDPSEIHDVAADHPQVVAELLAEAERHRATLAPVVSQLDLPRAP